MTTLGVDVGTKHFGLALADGPLAIPLPSFQAESLPQAAHRLATLIKKHQVKTVVLGLPEGQLAQTVHLLISDLQPLTAANLLTHPETLSTKEALAKLRSGGAKRRKLKNDHSYAACLILEDYLESLQA